MDLREWALLVIAWAVCMAVTWFVLGLCPRVDAAGGLDESSPYSVGAQAVRPLRAVAPVAMEENELEVIRFAAVEDMCRTEALAKYAEANKDVFGGHYTDVVTLCGVCKEFLQRLIAALDARASAEGETSPASPPSASPRGERGAPTGGEDGVIRAYAHMVLAGLNFLDNVAAWCGVNYDEAAGEWRTETRQHFEFQRDEAPVAPKQKI